MVDKSGRLMVGFYDEDSRIFLPKEKAKFRSSKCSVNRNMQLCFVGNPNPEFVKVSDKPTFVKNGFNPKRGEDKRKGNINLSYEQQRFACQVEKVKLVFGSSTTKNRREIIGDVVKCPPMVLLPGKDLCFMGSSWHLRSNGCFMNHPLVSKLSEPSLSESSSASMNIDIDQSRSNEVVDLESSYSPQPSSHAKYCRNYRNGKICKHCK